jgi:hypothetical protein
MKLMRRSARLMRRARAVIMRPMAELIGRLPGIAQGDNECGDHRDRENALPLQAAGRGEIGKAIAPEVCQHARFPNLTNMQTRLRQCAGGVHEHPCAGEERRQVMHQMDREGGDADRSF